MFIGLAKNNIAKLFTSGLFVFVIVGLLAPIQYSATQNSNTIVFGLSSSVVLAQDADFTGPPPPPETQLEKESLHDADQGSSCAEKGWTEPFEKTWCVIVDSLGRMILQLGASIIWVSGIALDKAIEVTVLEMGQKMNTPGGLGEAVDESWTIVRDICNLAFIFGFIYLGFRAIFDSDDAQVKKFLSRIIIGALFINFSLFFAQVIIDISNLIAIEVYKVMVSNGNIAETLFDQLGLVTVYTSPPSEYLAGIGENGSIWFYIMVTIMLLISAFTFFSAAILFLTRFVYLILIMIASPILFAGMVFPQTDKASKDLWRKLINYAIFAPVYLLMIYLSINVISKLGIANNAESISTSLLSGNNLSTGEFTINFGIAIFFMIASVVVAKKAGIAGADGFINVGNSARKSVQSFAARSALRSGFGAARLAATGAVAVGNMGQKDFKESWRATRNINMKGLAGVQDKMRKSNSKTAKFTATLMRGTGVDASIQTLNEAKFGGSASIASKDKEQKEINRARVENAQTDDMKDAVKEAERIQNDPNATENERNDAMIAMERSLENASTEQLVKVFEEFENNNEDLAEFIGGLTSRQYEALLKVKQEVLDDGQKATIRASRATATEERLGIQGLAPTDPNARTRMRRANSEQLDSLPFATLQAQARNLTSKQIDDIKNITATEKTVLKARRASEFDGMVHSSPAGARDLLDYINNDAEIAQLPASILLQPRVAGLLNENTLNKILDNDKISPEDRTEIKRIITQTHGDDVHNNYFNRDKGRSF